jgi:hypothetical protein
MNHKITKYPKGLFVAGWLAVESLGSMPENAGCFKNSFTALKAYADLFRGLDSVLNCSKTHRVLPGIVMVNVTSSGNAGCFKKKSFTIVFQMLLGGECYENVYT